MTPNAIEMLGLTGSVLSGLADALKAIKPAEAASYADAGALAGRMRGVLHQLRHDINDLSAWQEAVDAALVGANDQQPTLTPAG